VKMMTEGLTLLVAAAGLVISISSAYYQHLGGARLRWLSPMLFGLEDQVGKRAAAIAVAIGIHNYGARPGRIQDIAVRVVRDGQVSRSSCFQAVFVGRDVRHVTLSEIESNHDPMTPLVIAGHSTVIKCIEFVRRTSGDWAWLPGMYSVEILALDSKMRWRMQTSFEFSLSSEDIVAPDPHWGGERRVARYQRWTRKTLEHRDALCDASSRCKEPRWPHVIR
jgi:hypothetical protein